MNLYRNVYGLTELGVYATAFILWLAFAFNWFAFTVLRGAGDRLAAGLILSVFAATFALHSLHPDAFIVRTNIERVSEGRESDVEYAAGLSADALPALVDTLPALCEADRRCVEAELRRRWSDWPVDDWRVWSWGRHRGARALAAAREASNRR